MSQKNKFTKARIVILGSSGVGKTAFAVRYITKRFIGEYDPNKETLYNHRIQLDKEEINLEILDTANDTSEVSTESIIKHADGFVLIYSVTDIGSYRWLDKAYKTISDVRSADDHTPIVIVANKIDLSHVRVVSQEDGLQISKKMDAPLFELSVADSTSGVAGAMEDVLRQAKTEFSRRTAGGRMLLGVKRVFKKKIGRSRSENIF